MRFSLTFIYLFIISLFSLTSHSSSFNDPAGTSREALTVKFYPLPRYVTHNK